MNLECPGCHAKLKLDPAKLPAGTTTAVCPKCRTKIPLPSVAGAGSGDVSVQCPGCGARLRVNRQRLKPGITQSKCPKCGGLVDLPAAAPSPPPAPQAMPASAQTRRFDAHELGMILGAKPGSAQEAAASAPPIAVPAPSAETSDIDLGSLIDQSVEGLGSDASDRMKAVKTAPSPAIESRTIAVGSPSFAAGAAETAPVPKSAPRPEPDLPSIPLARPTAAERSGDRPTAPRGAPAPGPELSQSALRERAARAPGDSSSARNLPDTGRLSRPDSEARGAPRFDRALGVAAEGLAASAPLSGASMAVSGILSGALVGGALATLTNVIPENLIPTVPPATAALIGERLATLLLIVLLSAIGAVLGGAARPPEGSSGPPVSAFRTGVASGLLGLLAGIGLAFARGGFDVAGVASWLVALTIAGILSAPIARILFGRH